MGKTHQALLAVQCALKVPKAQVNEFGGFKYRSAEDIIAALKPLLLEKKLLLTINDDLVQKDDRHYIKATVRVCHVEDEDAIEITAFAREPDHKTKQDDAMVTGGSSSYARKYALAACFLCEDSAYDPDATHEFKDEKKEEPAELDADAAAGLINHILKLGNELNSVKALGDLWKDNVKQISRLPKGQLADLTAWKDERKAELQAKK
jgi:hypothetical protein